MYKLIRISIEIIGILPLLFIKRISPPHKKKYLIAYLVFFTVFCLTVSFVPLEKMLFTFNSPEEAFEFSNLDVTNIELVINGESTSYVIGKKDNTFVEAIISKKENGWNGCRKADTKIVKELFEEGFSISFHRYKKTNEIYVRVISTLGKDYEVSDNCHSTFYPINAYNKLTGDTMFIKYAYVSYDGNNYSITINGKEYVFNNQWVV